MYALAILRYRKPLEEVLQHVDAHRAYCQGLKQEKLLIASGPLVPRSGGAMLLRVPDDEAQATLDSIRDNDPYTRFGIAQYEVWPWAPAFGAEDLDRLVTTQVAEVARLDVQWRRPPLRRSPCRHPHLRDRHSTAAAKSRFSLQPSLFSVGIIAANYLWRSPQSWLIASLVALLGVAFLYRRAPQTAFGLALVALIPLGGFYLQARDAAAPTIAENLQPFVNGDNPVDVTAYVVREGLVRDSAYGGKQESVDVTAEQLQLGNRTLQAAVGIRLTIYSKQTEEDEASEEGAGSPLPVYTYGQRLHCIAKLRLPRNYRNPGAMDMAGYLASQGIRLTGSSRASSVEVLPGFEGSRVGLWRSAARRSVLAHIMQLWPGERGALMQAMLIGGRAFFGRDIKAEFQRTGTYHILVISGINVGILAFAVFWALRKLPLGETWATILTILLSWGYAFLADLGSPIVRATITLGIYMLARLLFRERAALNGLGVAALGILLVSPRTLFEASFQLTFLSVIAVAGIAVPVLRRTVYPFRKALSNLDSPAFDFARPTRAAQFRFDARLARDFVESISNRRVANLLVVGPARFVIGTVELLFTSTVIQVALALPMAWYFHRATTMALPANALVIPIAGILLLPPWSQ